MKPKQKKPMPITLTDEQKTWLKAEAERTGETMTSVVRRLIKNQMEAK